MIRPGATCGEILGKILAIINNEFPGDFTFLDKSGKECMEDNHTQSWKKH